MELSVKFFMPQRYTPHERLASCFRIGTWLNRTNRYSYRHWCGVLKKRNMQRLREFAWRNPTASQESGRLSQERVELHGNATRSSWKLAG